MGCRCFWDQNTDNYAEETYMNEHLFCVAAALGIDYYCAIAIAIAIAMYSARARAPAVTLSMRDRE